MILRSIPVFTHSMKFFTFVLLFCIYMIIEDYIFYGFLDEFWVFFNTFYCVVHVFVNLDMKIGFILL